MKYKFLILLFSFFAVNALHAQQNKFSLGESTITKSKLSVFQKNTVTKLDYTPSLSMLISPNFYCNNLGYFCKQEIKIEHKIHVPFVFRLGSVKDVDYLEGKRSSSILLR